MQIEQKKHAGFNRDAPEAQKCRKKLKNDDFDDDDDDDDDDEKCLFLIAFSDRKCRKSY